MLRLIILFLLVSTPAYAQTPDIPDSRAQIKLSFSPVVKKISPSVVNIFTKREVTRNISPFMNDPFFSQFFGGPGFQQKRLESSLGSGVIVDAGGLVITNAHVIRDADQITAGLQDGRELPAMLVLQDDASDLALLRLETNGEKLPAAALQPSETLEVGDLVMAIGNPFGVGQTVTSGIVSALARSSLNINDFNFFIQTDAAINPGNSGGPLVSMDGGVVGINSAIYSKDGGSLGIGFAIPSEMVATLLAAEKAGQITKSGVLIRPWVGLSTQSLTPELASSLGLKTPTGALISSIHADSPAVDAGLKQGDVVTAVNGHSVQDAAEFRFRMAMVPTGGKADVTYKRKGEESTTSLSPVSPPDSPARDSVTVSGKNPLQGATIMNINPAVEVELGLKNTPDKGVVVGDVARGSLASQVVQVGDVILGINKTPINSPKDAVAAIKSPTRQGWMLKINSGGQIRTLLVR